MTATIQLPMFATEELDAMTPAPKPVAESAFAGVPEPDVDLTAFDIVLLSSSGGKDSMVTILEMSRRAKEEGVEDRLVVVHADLGEAEWPGTKDLARLQAERLGIRFEVVTKGVDFVEYAERRGMWPDARRRYCTSDLKRGPIETLYTRLANEIRQARTHEDNEWNQSGPVRILSCMGMRAQESPARAKRSMLERNPCSSGRRDVWNYLPIHRWSEDRVWAEIADSPLSDLVHPAYQIVGRLSCSFCIFSPRAALIAAGRQRPELLARYVAAEESMGHTFRLDVSLAEISDAIAAGETGERVTTWRM